MAIGADVQRITLPLGPGMATAFAQALERENVDASSIARLWKELEQAYRTPARHYHDLAHLDHMLRMLEPVAGELSDPVAVVLAIAYHDAVYEVVRKDNEERSAQLAMERLGAINVDPTRVSHCCAMILATKSHAQGADTDTDFLTDADLSVLGAAPDEYRNYADSIRREYAIYPDLLYRPGRRKVLGHFLGMPHIFKTRSFRDRFEAQARRNLANELAGKMG